MSYPGLEEDILFLNPSMFDRCMELGTIGPDSEGILRVRKGYCAGTRVTLQRPIPVTPTLPTLFGKYPGTRSKAS